jgi:hypothetical protein
MTKSIGKVCLVFALFFGILVCFFLFQRNTAREEVESYRRQLIALCAVIKHADIENADILTVADPIEIGVSDGSEEVAIVFVIDKEFMERRYYAVYSNGRVIYTGRGSHGTSFNKSEDWGNHPEFSKIGKK